MIDPTLGTALVFDGFAAVIILLVVIFYKGES